MEGAFWGGWEEEAEDVGEAGGPGGFVVEGVGDAEVGEVDGGTGDAAGGFAPATLEEAAVEEVGVAEMAEAFGGTHVEPDAEVGFGTGASDAVEDGSLVPPDAGGEDGDFAEDVGVVEGDGEGDEGAEGGATDGGVGWVGEGAEGLVDEGLEFVDEEAAVAATVSSVTARVAGVGVFCHPPNAGVVDADEDDGFDLVGAGEGVGCGVGLPGAVRDEGGSAVNEVLAVVEIEDGEAAKGLGEVGLGEIDEDVATGGEEAGAEVAEEEETGVLVERTGLVGSGRERCEGAIGVEGFGIDGQG